MRFNECYAHDFLFLTISKIHRNSSNMSRELSYEASLHQMTSTLIALVYVQKFYAKNKVFTILYTIVLKFTLLLAALFKYLTPARDLPLLRIPWRSIIFIQMKFTSGKHSSLNKKKKYIHTVNYGRYKLITKWIFTYMLILLFLMHSKFVKIHW